MAQSLYQVGDILPMRKDGKFEGNAEVTGFSADDSGDRVIELKVIELAPDYSGPFKLGTILTFPEQGFVGTFKTP